MRFFYSIRKKNLVKAPKEKSLERGKNA